MNKYYFRQALKITSPVFFGYIAIGIPFGLMLVSKGYPWWMSIIMSATMYAGAGQYVAVGLFASGATLYTIAITELFVNIRHIVYGLSLITPFKNVGKWKPYLIFALTDETYAVLTGCSVPKGAEPGPFYGTIALLNQSYWILGSVIGAVAGNFIPPQYIGGVDFALCALFAVLLIEQIKKSHDVVPPIIGLLTCAGAIVLNKVGILPSENILIVAIAFGIAAIMIVRGRNIRGAGATVGKTDKTDEKSAAENVIGASEKSAGSSGNTTDGEATK